MPSRAPGSGSRDAAPTSLGQPQAPTPRGTVGAARRAGRRVGGGVAWNRAGQVPFEYGGEVAAFSFNLSETHLVFQIDSFVVAVKVERGGSLFLRPEAGFLGPAEGQLILDSGAGKVDGEQARFHPVDELEDAREIGGLDGGRKPERNVVGDAHSVLE